MVNKKTSIVGLVVAFLLFIFSLSQLDKLQFDYELENFFPQGDPDLAYYQNFSKTFGYDNDYLLLGFESNSHVFDIAFLQQIDSCISKINKLQSTVKIFSPTTISFLVKNPLGYFPIPLLHLNDPDKLKKDSIKLKKHPLFNEMFLSKTNKSIKVIVTHQRFKSKEEGDQYVAEIKEILRTFKPHAHIAGKAIAQTAFVDAVKTDFTLFILIALFLVIIWLVRFMKKFRFILTSIFIACLSVISTIGIMAFTGKKIDVLSSLLPTILLVVSMSNTIHLFSHFQNNYQKTRDIHFSLNRAMKEVGVATWLTAITTAAGFLTLIMIDVKPIIDLGIYAACGIILSFVITYLIFPSILYFSKFRPSINNESKILQNIIEHLYQTINIYPKQIIFFSLFLLVISIIGLTQLQIDAFLVNDLPKDNQVRDDFIYFDQEFTGSKPFTLSIWPNSRDNSIFSKKIITEIEKIESIVHTEIHAGDLISPATLVKLANQNIHKTSPRYYQLPASDNEWKKSFDYLEKTHLDRYLATVCVDSIAQITGYFQDLGSKDASVKLGKLATALSTKIDSNLISYKITGTTPLVNKSHEMLSSNLIKGLLLAIGIVGAIAAILFRSWFMLIITLIPNLLPILFVAGMMGFFGIPLNLSTSVIFAISFGIVVDDTIHFLSQFKNEYISGKTKKEAINGTLEKTGRPIIITTIILTSGFLTFCFSNFNVAFYMGLFVSISFTTALIADLYLLPTLILWWLPEHAVRHET